MKKIYVKENGKKISVVVSDEVENALTETRRAIWRNEAKERYYRELSLDAMTDKDDFAARTELNPEFILIERERYAEQQVNIAVALKSCTPEQICLIKMLCSGMSVTAISESLGVGKTAVSNMRIRIQEKFKKFLK